MIDMKELLAFAVEQNASDIHIAVEMCIRDRNLMDECREVVQEALDNCLDRGITDWGKLKNTIRDALSDFLWKKMKRSPMILPIITEV